MPSSDWLPSEILIKKLFTGSVFLMPHAYDESEEKLRFFIVLNYRPENDEYLLLLSPSTKIDTRRYFAEREKDLIDLPVGAYPVFHKHCILDCAKIEKKHKSEVIKHIDAGNVTFFAERFPQRILTDIQSIIISNPSIKRYQKKLIAPPGAYA
jgi:hypothetical protein